MSLLEMAKLSVDFPTSRGTLKAVDGVGFSVEEGDILGIVGESGSGKSVAMLALMGLVAYPGIVTADRLVFGGRNLLTLSARERRRIAGKDVAMIFQEPMTSLNPCFTIGYQIMETLRIHEGGTRRARRERAIALLEQVGIPAPAGRLAAFPHQLSGGMNQRVMIAMAIACNPRLLIADEPTTALDVTIQAQILELLMSLQRERGMALILITHDMGVVAETAAARHRHVRGPDRRGGAGRGPLRRPAPPLHRGALGRPPRAQPRRAEAAHDLGPGARARRPSVGLSLQSALRLRRRALPQRGAAARGLSRS